MSLQMVVASTVTTSDKCPNGDTITQVEIKPNSNIVLHDGGVSTREILPTERILIERT